MNDEDVDVGRQIIDVGIVIPVKRFVSSDLDACI